MTPFYVAGAVLAGWALVVTALGLTRHDFPGSRTGERIVQAISVVLVASAIGTGIVTAANEDEGHAEPSAAHAEEGEPHAGEDEAAADQGAGEDDRGSLALKAAPSGELAFESDALEAEAGRVTIVMENPSPVAHNVAIEGGGVDVQGEVVGTGRTSEASAELEPGEYTFYCSVAGHRQGGMEGKLTVR